LKYFYQRFATSVKLSFKNRGLKFPAMPEGQIRDKLHNEMYYSQFLKRMETDIVALSNKFWPIFFFLWLFYTIILMVLRVMISYFPESTKGQLLEYYGNLHNATPERSLEFLKAEQFNNQIIFFLLIVEFLSINYYFSMPENIIIMPPAKVKVMVAMMVAKMDYYLHDKPDRANDTKKDQYLFSIQKFEQLSKTDIRGDNSVNTSQIVEKEPEEADPHEVQEDIRNIFKPVFGEEEEEADEMRDEESNLTKTPPRLTLKDDDLGKHFSSFLLEREERCMTNLNLESMAAEAKSKLQKPAPPPQGPSTRKLSKEINEEEMEAPESETAPVVHLCHMNEESPVLIKVIFRELNLHKHSMGIILNSMSYIVSRAMILPLLFGLGEGDWLNIIFLIITLIYSFRFTGAPFEVRMKYFMPIFTVIIFLENVWAFANRFLVFLLKIEAQAAATPGGYTKSIYRMSLIGFACVGFSFVILGSKYIFTELSVIKHRSDDAWFQFDPERKFLLLDFPRWKHYSYIGFTNLKNMAYMYVNDIYMTLTIVFCLSNPKEVYLLVVMFGIFLFNLLMKFKKQFNTLAMEENAMRIFSLLIKALVLMLFMMEFYFQTTETLKIVMKIFLGNDVETNGIYKFVLGMKLEKPQGSHYMIILSLIIYDFMRVNNFVWFKRKITKAKEIHIKFSDICESQDQNESKFYERVMIMIANERLQNQLDQYLKKGFMHSKADLNYHKTDIKNKLKVYRMDFLRKFLTPFQVWLIELIEGIYIYFVKLSSIYIYQDILFLLTKVSQIDKGLIDSNDVNLVDFLSDDLRIFDNMFRDIMTFYSNLRAREMSEYDLYKAKMNEFEQHGDRMEFKKEYEIYNQTEKPATPLIGHPKLKIEDRYQLDEAQAESTPKDKEVLKAAALHLCDYLTKPAEQSKVRSNLQTHGNRTSFYIPDLDITVAFDDIRLDFLNTTEGFMSFKPLILLKIIRSVVYTNVENLICFYLISVLFFSGGLTSAILLTIIFFRILIEEKGGKLFWWEILNVIFFVQFALKIYMKVRPKDSWVLLTTVITFISGPVSEKSSLDLEAIAQILIMWLIQSINKKIVNIPESKNCDNTGVSIGRVPIP
jgi:hypothetical protein